MRKYAVKYIVAICVSIKCVLGVGMDNIMVFTGDIVPIERLPHVISEIGKYLASSTQNSINKNEIIDCQARTQKRIRIKQIIKAEKVQKNVQRDIEAEADTLDGLDNILESNQSCAACRSLLRSIEEFSEEPLSMNLYPPDEDYRSINPKACSFMAISKLDPIQHAYIQNVLRMAPNYTCSKNYKEFEHRDINALDNIESYSVEMRMLEAHNQMKKFYTELKEIRERLLEPQLKMSAFKDFEIAAQTYFAYINRQVAKFSDVLLGFTYNKKTLNALKERKKALHLAHPKNEAERRQKEYIMANKSKFYPEIEHAAFAKGAMLNMIFQIEELVPHIDAIYNIIKQGGSDAPIDLNCIKKHIPELKKTLAKSFDSIIDFNPDSFDNEMLSNAGATMEEALKIFRPMMHVVTRSAMEIFAQLDKVDECLIKDLVPDSNGTNPRVKTPADMPKKGSTSAEKDNPSKLNKKRAIDQTDESDHGPQPSGDSVCSEREKDQAKRIADTYAKTLDVMTEFIKGLCASIHNNYLSDSGIVDKNEEKDNDGFDYMFPSLVQKSEQLKNQLKSVDTLRNRPGTNSDEL
ncbi:hypothetical protein NEAUS04_0323 [Nematocida ausubeli]|nr:hypothetical protein NEAUS04_0323 [Nematocida ausubeli]